MTTHTALPNHLVAAARSWVSECVWQDIEPADVSILTRSSLERGIEANYDGGVRQFIADAS